MTQRLPYVNLVLVAVSLFVSVVLFSRVEDQRESRNLDNAQSDLIVCSRANYQDVRDKLQDQLLRDLVSTPPGASAERRELFSAARRQLEYRLATQPPSGASLLKRWRGDPVSGITLEERALEAAGPQARAEARDKGDLVAAPVNCDDLPSQRPFTR